MSRPHDVNESTADQEQSHEQGALRDEEKPRGSSQGRNVSFENPSQVSSIKLKFILVLRKSAFFSGFGVIFSHDERPDYSVSLLIKAFVHQLNNRVSLSGNIVVTAEELITTSAASVELHEGLHFIKNKFILPHSLITEHYTNKSNGTPQT